MAKEIRNRVREYKNNKALEYLKTQCGPIPPSYYYSVSEQTNRFSWGVGVGLDTGFMWAFSLKYGYNSKSLKYEVVGSQRFTTELLPNPYTDRSHSFKTCGEPFCTITYHSMPQAMALYKNVDLTVLQQYYNVLNEEGFPITYVGALKGGDGAYYHIVMLPITDGGFKYQLLRMQLARVPFFYGAENFMVYFLHAYKVLNLSLESSIQAAAYFGGINFDNFPGPSGRYFPFGITNISFIPHVYTKEQLPYRFIDYVKRGHNITTFYSGTGDKYLFKSLFKTKDFYPKVTYGTTKELFGVPVKKQIPDLLSITTIDELKSVYKAVVLSSKPFIEELYYVLTNHPTLKTELNNLTLVKNLKQVLV